MLVYGSRWNRGSVCGALSPCRSTEKFSSDPHGFLGGLNHIGVCVRDLVDCEARVKAAGFTPRDHAEYEPGSRFYFHDFDGIAYEMVSYSFE